MKNQLALIFALAVEALLLILIFLVVVLGILGVFLPFLPGLFLFGAAAALYTLLAKGGKGRITPFIDRFLANVGGYLYKFSLIKKIMTLLAAFRQRNKKNISEIILTRGLMLCGYNIALALGFLFGFTVVSIVGNWLAITAPTSALLALLLFFVFCSVSAVVWYRFGQLLGEHLRARRIINAALTVLVSLLPSLALLIVFSTVVGVVGGFTNEFVAMIFLGLLLMSILSASFEFLMVAAGVLTRTK